MVYGIEIVAQSASAAHVCVASSKKISRLACKFRYISQQIDHWWIQEGYLHCETNDIHCWRDINAQNNHILDGYANYPVLYIKYKEILRR